MSLLSAFVLWLDGIIGGLGMLEKVKIILQGLYKFAVIILVFRLFAWLVAFNVKLENSHSKIFVAS